MCVLYLLSPGAKLRQDGGRIVLERDGERLRSLHPQEIECVVQGRRASITTPVIYVLLEQGSSVFFVDGRGALVGQLGDGAKSFARSRRQYEAFTDEAVQLVLAREVVRRKLTGQRRILLGYAKTHRDLELARLAEEIKKYRDRLAYAEDADELRGLEGIASRRYFDGFPHILDLHVWRWQGRSRRPPRDGVNALLSYGYAFLEREVRLALLAAGLEAQIGFFHTNDGRRESLVLDLMEPFRPVVIDRFVLKLMNRGQFHPEDFDGNEQDGFHLKPQARRHWIEVYEGYMQHPCQEYEGRSPREQLIADIRAFAAEIFRNARSVV